MAQERALAAVIFRESLIERARQLVYFVKSNEKSEKKVKASNFIVHELVELSNEFRDYGLRCVSRIVQWSLENQITNPSSSIQPFIFNGEDYLIKMLNDLDFIHEVFYFSV